MRLFIVGILAALAAVQARPHVAVGVGGVGGVVEGRSDHPSYGSLQVTAVKGFIRYYDNKGIERLLSFEYPNAIYFVRSCSPYLASETQYNHQEHKARSEHFFMWADKRQEAINVEINRLRRMGQGISQDLMAQHDALGRIIASRILPMDSSDATVKRILNDHLGIWHEARLKVSQLEANRLRSLISERSPAFYQPQHQHQSEIHSSGAAVKSGVRLESASGYLHYEPIAGETPEQKKAREEHYRIYNEQLKTVQQAEAIQLSQSQTEAKDTPTIANELRIQADDLKSTTHLEQSHAVRDTPEVLAAKEEHQRLYSAVKQRDDLQKTQTATASATDNLEGIVVTNPYIPQELKTTPQEQPILTPVMDTPEVIRAREEHLRLVNEAKLRAQAQPEYHHQPEYQHQAEHQHQAEYHHQAEHQQQLHQLRIVPGVQQPIHQIQSEANSIRTISAQKVEEPQVTVVDGQVQDTPEVQRAREAHLRIVNTVKTTSGYPTETIADSSIISEAERIKETERQRKEQLFLEEEERLRRLEEERQREADRLLEEQRISEEKRLMELERIRLEEEERNRLKADGGLIAQTDSQAYIYQPTLKFAQPIQTAEYVQVQQAQQQQLQQQQQYQQNPFLYGAAVKSIGLAESAAQPSNLQFPAGTHALNLQEPLIIRYAPDGRPEFYTSGGLRLTGQIDEATAQQYTNAMAQAVNLQFPAGTHFLNLKNPLIIRYGADGRPEFYTDGGLKLSTQTLGSAGDIKLRIAASEGASPLVASETGSSSFSYGTQATGFTANQAQTQTGADALAALDKATREHFRAHEIALEQLRLANTNEATQLKKDC